MVNFKPRPIYQLKTFILSPERERQFRAISPLIDWEYQDVSGTIYSGVFIVEANAAVVVQEKPIDKRKYEEIRSIVAAEYQKQQLEVPKEA